MVKDYLDILYNREYKPLSNYVDKLVDYIIYKTNIEKDVELTLLEPGVGLGDHLRVFKKRGFIVQGLDISPRSKQLSPDLNIDIIDVNDEKLPFEDSSFDIIYSKSFIEHLDDPFNFVNESFRILRPGGTMITLTPDWVTNYKKFYDDYTHKSPFSKISLKNIKTASGFEGVNAFTFRQLPYTWYNPLANGFCAMIAPFIHHRTETKFLRWSRELMVIGFGKKPLKL